MHSQCVWDGQADGCGGAAVEWGDSFTQLSAVDRQGSLVAEDLNRLGMAAFLIGRIDRAASVVIRGADAVARQALTPLSQLLGEAPG